MIRALATGIGLLFIITGFFGGSFSTSAWWLMALGLVLVLWGIR